MSKVDYEPEVCECCGQTKTYLLTLSKGARAILRGIVACIQDKGINCVHIDKEVRAKGYITTNQRTNIALLQAHGLVAKVRGEVGNYLLTKKGAAWLRGDIRVPKYAIKDKLTDKQIGYYEPEKYTVHVGDFTEDDPHWEVANYDVLEGNIIAPETDDVNDDTAITKPKPPETPKCLHGLPTFVKCPQCTK